MISYENKCWEMPQNNPAIINFNGKTYPLSIGFHVIGRNCKNFVIEDESVDEKHALISITTSRHQIIDLESEKGTYVDNEKIDSSYILRNKVSSIRFGNFNIKYTISNQSDSGFLDSKITTSDKDNSEIVESSPHQKRYGNRSRIRSIRNRRPSLTNSSTPNSKHLFSSSSNEESEIERVCKTNKKSDTSATNDESFYVPETQQLEQSKIKKKKKNINIFDTIVDENVKQFINDMSMEDDFYIPETQEIFSNSKKLDFTHVVNINTQEFNKSDNNLSIGNESENLCPYLGVADKTISVAQDVNNINKQKKSENPNDETENMSQLKWNETEFEIRSNTTTPDIDFENLTEENKTKDDNDLTDQRQDSVTPDLVFENEEQGLASLREANLDKKLQKDTWTASQAKGVNPSYSNKIETCNDFMDNDDLLVPTQPFILNTTKETFSKRLTVFNKSLDLLEETEIFVNHGNCNYKKKKSNRRNNSPEKNVSMASSNFTNLNNSSILNQSNNVADQVFKPSNNTILSKKSMDPNIKLNYHQEDDDMSSTQVFVPPKKENGNMKDLQKLSNISNFSSNSDDLDCTQIFVPPSSSSSNTSKSEDGNEKANYKLGIIDKMENKANRKRSHNASLKDRVRKKKEPESNKKSLSGSIPCKTQSKEGFDENFKSPCKTVSGKSVTSVDVDFMLDICTPSIDLIKLPVKEQSYIKVIEKVKKPINRIFVEETEDEYDQIFELQKKLNKNGKENLVNNIKNAETKTESEDKYSVPLEMESEETPEFDFLQPVITIDEIKRFDKKTNRKSKNKNKFIMEETQANEPNFTELEIQLNKIPRISARGIKKKESDKSEKCSTTKTAKSQKSINQTKSTTSIISDEMRKDGKNSRNNAKHNYITNSDSETKYSEQNEKLNSSTRSSRNSRRNKMTLTFTKVDETKYIETVKNIGYTIVKDPEDASLIITNNDISRTWKFLIGLAKGIPIISVDWLNKIQEKNFSYVHYDNFYVKDKKAEKKFNFNLRETLNLAINSCPLLFHTFNFIITTNTIPPKSEMERIIRCAGGTIINEKNTFPKNVYVVSDKKDSKLWPTFQKNSTNLKIIKTEGVLLSIMQQRIRFDDHIFK